MALLLFGLGAAPVLALHRETPGAVRVTSGGTHVPSPVRSWGEHLVFTSEVDLLATGSVGPQIYVWSLADFDCNRDTTRPTTSCADPPRPSLRLLTTGRPLGNPDHGSVDETGAMLVFDADGTYGGGDGAEGRHRQIFRLDAETGALVQVTSSGAGDSTRPTIDRFGSTITFESTAPLLGSAAPPGVSQIFVRLEGSGGGAPTLLQLTAGAGPSTAAMPDLEGARIVFESTADLLGDGSDTGISQIFVAQVDRQTLAVRLLQITNGDGPSRRPYLAGGSSSRVVFESTASDLRGTTGEGSQIYSAATDRGSFPPITQHTQRDAFGDCFFPTIDATGEYVAFICTGDPLANRTSGQRVFVRAVGDGALVQLTGRGEARGPLAHSLGSFLVAFASNVDMSVLSPTFVPADLGDRGACGHQIQVLDYFDGEPGLPTWRGATGIGELPPDMQPGDGDGGEPPGTPHPTAETFAGALSCRVAPCAQAAECDDAERCNGSEACEHAACVPGAPLCDDGDYCNGTETCDPESGTCGPGESVVCDDLSPCSLDTCVRGRGCQSISFCDDGDACNGGETCDPETLACIPGVPPLCDDGNPCTDDACDRAAGCVVMANTDPCQDGRRCTTDDRCQGGVCLGTPTVCSDQDVCNGVETCNPATGACRAGTPLNCNDGSPCTTDSCDPLLGCRHSNNSAPCNDSNACTAGDVCGNGTCAGTPAVFCNDGDPCNGLETCNPGTGACQAGPPPACDDRNPCTDDSCRVGVGCVFTPNTAPCDDGDICTTNDVCGGGVCGGILVLCEDGDLCNGIEFCDSITAGCVPGLPLDCDDGDPCTTDSCDVVLGCLHVQIGGCSHVPGCSILGMNAAVAALRDALVTVPVDDLGGRRRSAQLRRLSAKAVTSLERVAQCAQAPGGTSTHACQKRLKRLRRTVCRRLETFAGLVSRGATAGRIAPALASHLGALAQRPRACCAVSPLVWPLTDPPVPPTDTPAER